MKLLSKFIIGVVGLTLLRCQLPPEPVASGDFSNETLAKPHKHITGSIEFLRPGNKGNQNTDKLTFAEFEAHEASNVSPIKGNFYFRVYSVDTVLHREIVADVNYVLVDELQNKGWFLATVISDTKGCGGNGLGGHDSGCSSSGGCEGDDNGDHTDGCTGQDSGHDSGCAGDDGEEHSDGCAGSSGSPSGGTTHGNGGNAISGKNCRIGQVLAVKVHDVGSPGTNGDGITWKWFDQADSRVSNLYSGNVESWPHLCKKTILSGNLALHY